MVRFITCGSVDDGKSTLIGRLLYESHLIFDDHLGHQTLDQRVTDSAIDRRDEIQPVRRQSRCQVRHVDDAPTTQTTRSG